jgi:hypothetical protein
MPVLFMVLSLVTSTATMLRHGLGRGLISAQPKADRSKLDESEVIGSELVIAGGDTPALLDLIEEPVATENSVRPEITY